MKEHCLKGSFTVEAAIVVPMVIFGIVALIWIIFYLHNSVAATADLDICIFQMEKNLAENRELPSGTVINLKENFKNVLGEDVTAAFAEYDGGKIRAGISISRSVSEEGVVSGILQGIGRIRKEREIRASQRSETARLIKAGGELLGDVINIFKDDKKE